VTPINDQLEQLASLAERHYPHDMLARQAYHIAKLEERLREFAAMRLPVREMREE
jgi:hypothetical protein